MEGDIERCVIHLLYASDNADKPSDMFHLWSLAEQDLLSDKVPYRLRDTGQGLNRVQAAPKTSRMMHAILHKAQSSVGTWIGSSVIHMGGEYLRILHGGDRRRC